MAFLAVIMALLLFVAAGTISYWQGWIYLAVFFGASLLTTIDLMKRDPALLERRLSAGPFAEKRTSQRIIMIIASVSFLLLLVIPAIDHRFGWSQVPAPLVILSDLLVAVGFFLVFRVYQENTFTSATIQVAENQKVITTGPYSIVRHPMYASSLLYVIGTPLALGSFWGLVAVVGFLPALIWRLKDEEQMLATELPGYREYQHNVRYRLLPGVW
jgi:protein-S-isoprenylcysteine O-methyltransferase Ste14